MTSKRRSKLGFVGAAALVALTGHAWAQGTAMLLERLHRAAALNVIDDPQLKPWHLKLSFQLYDVKGAPTEKGTVEEWWAGPSMHKTVYTSPSYTSTEVQTKDGFYRSKAGSSVPNLLELVVRQVVHPTPSEEDIADSKPDLRRETIGKTPMDCIMLAQQIKNVAYAPFGLFPTYCFDRDKDSLRVSYDFGSQLVVRNKLGTFQQRTVAVDLTTLQNSITAVSAHVDALQSFVLNESELAPSADLEEVKQSQVAVASGVMAGLKVSGVNPHYPETSRRNHVSGLVILRARIGSDGHIHSLKVISTPDADLAIASLAAVRQWTYNPYLLNGDPVDVDTQITVHFNFGPAY
jgi:TonB family protein